MTDEEIEEFLQSHEIGVLGLSSERSPYLVPMAYGYDRGGTLYFSFYVGEESRKHSLVDGGSRASFLVYDADSVFVWRSVYAEGPIRRLEEEDRETAAEAMQGSWELEVFEEGGSTGELLFHEIELQEVSGLRFAEPPPGFRD